MKITREQLKGSRVLVTGGTGFLGRHVCDVLRSEYGATVTGIGHHDNDSGWGPLGVDLIDEWATRAFLHQHGTFDYLIHLAGHNGGIAFNSSNPWDVFRLNTLMAINVMQAAMEHGVKKVVSVVASCAYAGGEQGICYEEDFAGDWPHPSVACHGYAKRNLQLASQFAHAQHGLEAVTACPTTLYGPGDCYHPHKSKVVGGMIRRFVEAARLNVTSVTCWGSGKPWRDLLYAPDAARLLVETLRLYENCSQPLNLSAGQEFTVAAIAEQVAQATGYRGNILWDSSRPDGQYRKCLDTSGMLEVFGQEAQCELTTFKTGIANTVAHYIKQKENCVHHKQG